MAKTEKKMTLRHNEEFLYVGRRPIESGKLCPAFFRLKNGMIPKARELVLFAKTRARSVGSVYEIEVSDDETDEKLSVFPETLRFLREWENAEERAEWEALSVAEEGIVLAKKREKVADSWHYSLNPIRQALARTNSVGRSAILAEVIRYLLRPY